MHSFGECCDFGFSKWLGLARKASIEDDDLILNNPWIGPEKLVKWKDFLKSWELEYNKVVMMEPELQARLEVE